MSANGDCENSPVAPKEPPFIYDSMVTVLLGAEEHSFHVHKKILCESSHFFDRACNGDFTESKGTIKLPEQEPSTFRYFMHWLYTGKLRGYFYPDTESPNLAELEEKAKSEPAITYETGSQPNDEPSSTEFDVANYRDAHFHSLILLFILADVLQIHGLKDQIITLIIEVYGYEPKTKKGRTLLFWGWHYSSGGSTRRPKWIPCVINSINLAWRSLPLGSHLRKVLVLLFCDSILVVPDKDGEEDFDPSFLRACLNIMVARWYNDRGTTKWKADGMICNFHDHDRPCKLDTGKRSEDINKYLERLQDV